MLPPSGPTSGAPSIKTVEPSKAIARLKGIDVEKAAELVKDVDTQGQEAAPAAHPR